jgi:hypothetical protein
LVAVTGSDIDQRILLGELFQRRSQGNVILAADGEDRRLECRWRKVMWRGGDGQAADGVTDPDPGQAPKLADFAGAHRMTPDPGTLVEDAYRRHLVPAVPGPITYPQCAGKHSYVSDFLARITAFDFENAPAHGSVDVPRGHG